MILLLNSLVVLGLVIDGSVKALGVYRLMELQPTMGLALRRDHLILSARRQAKSGRWNMQNVMYVLALAVASVLGFYIVAWALFFALLLNKILFFTVLAARTQTADFEEMWGGEHGQLYAVKRHPRPPGRY